MALLWLPGVAHALVGGAPSPHHVVRGFDPRAPTLPSFSRPRVTVQRHIPARCGEPTQSDAGPGGKLLWFATEAFGMLAAAAKGGGGAPPSDDEERAAPLDVRELEARLRADWERQYFLTGDVDEGVYELDCEFADPFVSFKGLGRFKENLQNLAGGFITDSECRLLEFKLDGEKEFNTRAVVKLELGLPWKPVLAWVWGVTYVVNPETGRVCRHLEAWEVSAAEGIAQLFRPGNGLRGRG